MENCGQESHEITHEGSKLPGQLTSPFGAIVYRSDGKATKYVSFLESVDLGSVSIFRYKGRGFTSSCRRLEHIRSDGIDDFIFGLPLDIPKVFSQSGHSVKAQPGFGVLFSSSKPFQTFCEGPPGQDYSQLLMRISGPMLRRYVPNIDHNSLQPVEMCRGAGGIVKSLLDSLISECAGLSYKQADQFSLALCEAMVGLIFNESKLLTHEPHSRLAGYAIVRERARDFIKRNLSNTKLNVDLVARHCNVSPRYLYNAFESSSLTIGSLIREMRLENCRRDLQNRSIRHVTITEIAFRWGFNSATSFNRAYHTQFGKSPSEERLASAVS